MAGSTTPSGLRIAGDEARAMPRRINFTEAAVRRLTCPPGKARVRVYDTKVKGLTCSITASGMKAFYFYGRVKNHPRPVEHHLGKVDRITVDQARRLAKNVNAKAAEGQNPAETRREDKIKARQAVTVRQLWERYRAERLVATCKPQTLASDDSRYKLHLSAWAGRAVGGITRDDVAELHRSLTTTKTPNVADKVVMLLRRMMTWAKINPNPAGGRAVTFHGDTKRDRFLSLDELGRLTIALAEAVNSTNADALRFCLLTGARKGNVCGARWADVHLDQRLWIIPAAQSKNGKPLPIVLVPAAVELLKLRRTLTRKSPYVFPGRAAGQPVRELKGTWDTIRKAAGIGECRIHDLRHTLASHMAMGGASLLAIGKQLGHASQQSTARYSHLEVNAIRPATEAAVAAMFPAQSNAAASEAPAEGERSAEDKKRGERA